MQITYNLNNIEDAARGFWLHVQGYRVITFNGGLGAGKTTFTRALCSYLGVKDAVSSPTFSLINEYVFEDNEGKPVTIYHSDWYRINDEDEAINAGIEDMLQRKDAYCIIEWAERAPGLLPEHFLEVDFILEDDNNRTLVLKTR